jgi:hypothetical protein
MVMGTGTSSQTTAQGPSKPQPTVKSVVVVPPSTTAARFGGARSKTYSTLAGCPAGAYPVETLDIYTNPQGTRTFYPSKAANFSSVPLTFDPHGLFSLTDEEVKRFTAPECTLPKARKVTIHNPSHWDETRVVDKSPRPRFGRWVIMMDAQRLYPVETNDDNMIKVFQYWNGKFMWLPTAWVEDRRIPSKNYVTSPPTATWR